MEGSNFANKDQLLPGLTILCKLRVTTMKQLCSVPQLYNKYKSAHLKCLLKHTAGLLLGCSGPRFVARDLGAYMHKHEDLRIWAPRNIVFDIT